MKDEGAVDHSKQMVDLCLACKNLHHQERLGRTKTVDFEVVLQATVKNPASSPGRVSGDLSTLLLFLIFKHMELPNSASHTSKILQNF